METLTLEGANGILMIIREETLQDDCLQKESFKSDQNWPTLASEPYLGSSLSFSQFHGQVFYYYFFLIKRESS